MSSSSAPSGVASSHPPSSSTSTPPLLLHRKSRHQASSSYNAAHLELQVARKVPLVQIGPLAPAVRAREQYQQQQQQQEKKHAMMSNANTAEWWETKEHSFGESIGYARPSNLANGTGGGSLSARVVTINDSNTALGSQSARAPSSSPSTHPHHPHPHHHDPLLNLSLVDDASSSNYERISSQPSSQRGSILAIRSSRQQQRPNSLAMAGSTMINGPNGSSALSSSAGVRATLPSTNPLTPFHRFGASSSSSSDDPLDRSSWGLITRPKGGTVGSYPSSSTSSLLRPHPPAHVKESNATSPPTASSPSTSTSSRSHRRRRTQARQQRQTGSSATTNNDDDHDEDAIKTSSSNPPAIVGSSRTNVLLHRQPSAAVASSVIDKTRTMNGTKKSTSHTNVTSSSSTATAAAATSSHSQQPSLNIDFASYHRSGSSSIDLTKDVRPKSPTSRRIEHFLQSAAKGTLLQQPAHTASSSLSQIDNVQPPTNRRSMDLSIGNVTFDPSSTIDGHHRHRGSIMALSTGSNGTATNVAPNTNTTTTATATTSLTIAQQASNTMTLDELLQEAWKLHVRRSSFLHTTSSSSSLATGGGGGVGSSSNLIDATVASQELRKKRVSQMYEFINDLWCAILQDKLSSGVSITDSHMRHSFERFSKSFRRLHDTGSEAHTSKRTILDLRSSGLGKHAGTIIVRFVRIQQHYVDLRLAHNELGDEGAKPIFKMLRTFKAIPPGGVATVNTDNANDTSSSNTNILKGSKGDEVLSLGASSSTTTGMNRLGRRSNERVDSNRSRRARTLSPPKQHRNSNNNATNHHLHTSYNQDSRQAQVSNTSNVVPTKKELLNELRRQVRELPHYSGSIVSMNKRYPPIHSLDLSYNRLTSQSFQDLSKVLSESSLRTLNLGSDHQEEDGNRMGEEGGRALGKALANLQCPLQHLKLSGVGSQGWLTFMKEGLLKACSYSQLISLDVKGNWLPNDAFNLLMKACIKGMNSLTHLTLSKNRFSSYGSNLLCDYVRTTKVLKYLDLSNCCISTIGIGSLGNSGGLVSHSQSSGTNSTPPRDFFERFFESMSRNRTFCTIEELILDENHIGNMGAKQIGMSLAIFNTQLTHLKSLSMANCNMIDLQWFAYGLSRNTSLTKLNLSSNNFGDGGSIALSLGLQGRLELDAPLLPIFTTRKPYQSEEEEEEQLAAAAAAAEEEKKAEEEAKKQQHQLAPHAAQYDADDKRPLSDAIAESKRSIEGENGMVPPPSTTLPHVTPKKAASSSSSSSMLLLEPNLELLEFDGLKKVTSRQMIDARNLRAIPRAGRIVRVKKLKGTSKKKKTVKNSDDSDDDDDDDDDDGEGRSKRNLLYDLQPQQLNAAQLSNSKRVIVYSKKVQPICQLLHLNLIHCGLGDVGCMNLAQVLGMNYVLKELLLSDNDLTQQSGLTLLNTLKQITPFDEIRCIGLTLTQNRIPSDLISSIDHILHRRRSQEHRLRVRTYQLELREFRRLQRSKFGRLFHSIQSSIREEESLRNQRQILFDEFQSLKQVELQETHALERELQELRKEFVNLTQVQQSSYEDMLSKRLKHLQIEHGKHEESLKLGFQNEESLKMKLEDELQNLRTKLEFEKDETFIELKPYQESLKNVQRTIVVIKSNIMSARNDKNIVEREMIRAYFAILRNSGKGVSELFNTDDPEFQTTISTTTSPNVMMRKIGTNQDGTVSSTPADETSSPPSSSGASTPQPPKRVINFLGNDIVIDLPTQILQPSSSQSVRPTSPRTASALRLLRHFPTQSQREKVQLQLIDFARTQGRPIERILPFKASDLERMSPRTRSAIQRLRGDTETEWELNKRHAREAAMTKQRDIEDGRKGTRKKTRGAGGGSVSIAQGVSMNSNHSTSMNGNMIGVPNDDDPTGLPPAHSFDGSLITLSLDIVTSLLQLSTLTKVQGSTTVFNMVMHGLNQGDPIYVTLNASPEADSMQQAWEDKYGVFKPNIGKRVRKVVQNTTASSSSSSSSVSSLSGSTLFGSPVLPPPPPPPFTFQCPTNATSSVLIKQVSELLGVPIGSINSLSYQESRTTNKDDKSHPMSQQQQHHGGGGGGGNELVVRLIREKELKELSQKKKNKNKNENDKHHNNNKKHHQTDEKKTNKSSSSTPQASPSTKKKSTKKKSHPTPPVSSDTLNSSHGDSTHPSSVPPSSSPSYDPSVYAATTGQHHSSSDTHTTLIAQKDAAHTPNNNNNNNNATPTPNPDTSRRIAVPLAPPATNTGTLPRAINLMPFGKI